MWLQLQFCFCFFQPSIDGRTIPARLRVRLVHFRSPSHRVKKEGSAAERLARVRLTCSSLAEEGGGAAAEKALGSAEDQSDETRCLNAGRVSAFTRFPFFCLSDLFFFPSGCNRVGNLGVFSKLTRWKHFVCQGARKGDAEANKLSRCH